MAVLISSDLMCHMSMYVEPPAELCLIRVLGSDNEYVFRVRYRDAHLDYPFVVPLLGSADSVAKLVNFDEIQKALAAMSQLVLPPDAREHNPIYVGGTRPQPQILAPVSSELFHYWT